MANFMRTIVLLLWISVQGNVAVRKSTKVVFPLENVSRSSEQMPCEKIENSGSEGYDAEHQTNESSSVESMSSDEYKPGQSNSESTDSQISDGSDPIIPRSSNNKKKFQPNIPGWKIFQEMEMKIAEQLGTNRTRIYRLKRELKGKQFLSETDKQNQKLIKRFDGIRDEAAKDLSPGINFQRIYSKMENFELINTFMEMKEEYLARTGPGTAKSCQEIDREIAQKMGKTANAIHSLKKRMGLAERSIRRFTASEQKKIIRECERLKKENPDLNEFDFAAKYGLNRQTIGQWRKRHGFPGARKIYYTIQQKQEFLRQYWQIKQKHPELFDIQIARMLKISERDLANWKFKFGKKETDGEPVKIKSVQPDPMSPDVSRSSDQETQKIWTWNSATKRRRLSTRPRLPISIS